jgi:hypothetical protein
LAQRVESWEPDTAGQQLQRGFGFCETLGAPPKSTDAIPLSQAHNPIVRTFLSGVPSVNELTGGDEVTSMVAIPVVSDGEVSEVLTLYL